MGKIDRFFLEDNAFQYIKYDDTLKEKPSSFAYFTGERILVRRIISRQFRVMATIAQKDFVVKKDVYIFKPRNSPFSGKFLLAILNSRLLSCMLTSSSTSARKDDFTQITLSDLRAIPLPRLDMTKKADVRKHDRVVALVDQILALKQTPERDITRLDKKLDALIYSLYGLSAGEIQIVEG
jgi:hypothetical protein